jgi:hypothetical protein
MRPLGIDLHTAFSHERIPQHATVTGQRLGIALRPELQQQPRRPLDIREQERHRSPGKVLPHQRIMHRCPERSGVPGERSSLGCFAARETLVPHLLTEVLSLALQFPAGFSRRNDPLQCVAGGHV